MNRLRRSAAVGAVVALLCLLSAGPLSVAANAHSQLIASSPANGAVLDQRPRQVEFTFDDDLLPGANTISINDDNGNVVASPQVDASGRTLTAAWPSNAQGGTYQAAYRVVSADGHPVTGAITITIVPGGSTAEPTAATAPTADSVASGALGALEPSGGPSIATLLLFAVAAVALIVAAIALTRRAQRG